MTDFSSYTEEQLNDVIESLREKIHNVKEWMALPQTVEMEKQIREQIRLRKRGMFAKTPTSLDDLLAITSLFGEMGGLQVSLATRRVELEELQEELEEAMEEDRYRVEGRRGDKENVIE